MNYCIKKLDKKEFAPNDLLQHHLFLSTSDSFHQNKYDTIRKERFSIVKIYEDYTKTRKHVQDFDDIRKTSVHSGNCMGYVYGDDEVYSCR